MSQARKQHEAGSNHFSPKRLLAFNGLQGVTFQKIKLMVFLVCVCLAHRPIYQESQNLCKRSEKILPHSACSQKMKTSRNLPLFRFC
jgi:hypothetical protein